MLGLLVLSARFYLGQRREMTHRLAAEREVRKLAYQDVLTGLPNRRQFGDALSAAIEALPRAGATHAVLLLDLNGFKAINDVHGHGAGDDPDIAHNPAFVLDDAGTRAAYARAYAGTRALYYRDQPPLEAILDRIGRDAGRL